MLAEAERSIVTIFGGRPKPASAKKWPDCEPDRDGVVSMGMSTGFHQYKKAEVEPGRWQWVIDEEAMRSRAEREEAKANLWWALRTRVLNDEEMVRVRQYGSSLNTPSGISYNASDKGRELNEALYNQAKLQLLALKHDAPTLSGHSNE